MAPGYSCFKLPDVDYMTTESCICNLVLLVYLSVAIDAVASICQWAK